MFLFPTILKILNSSPSYVLDFSRLQEHKIKRSFQIYLPPSPVPQLLIAVVLQLLFWSLTFTTGRQTLLKTVKETRQPVLQNTNSIATFNIRILKVAIEYNNEIRRATSLTFWDWVRGMT